MTLTQMHAAFAMQQDRGDTEGWPFDPAIVEPPESAPLYLTSLVALSGIEPTEESELIEAATCGLGLLDAGLRSQAQFAALTDKVLAALADECGPAAAADLN